MKKKEHKLQNQNINTEEPEILEETKELEQDTKLNNEMLKLEEEIHTLQEEKKQLEEKVKLAQAESINYRRRKDEETESLLKFANQGIITEIIPIVDNFERAINKDENELSEELKKYFVGFKMMYSQLVDVLKKYGVEEINRVGEVFDPKQEQALLTDSREDLEDEVVIEVLLKGYKLKDRVIRPASVKINQK
jgi:molecular chaperone GrpE